MNDSYSRDISIKVRSQIEVRQKRGDFIGSFPVYGYLRSESNKHKLVVDGNAAETVKNIFKWKIKGLSNQKIADKLNQFGVLSPLEYKRSLNWAFTTSFKLKPQAAWSAMAVGRILKNEIYTGVMVQGKETTPNYKVKERVRRLPSDWIRVENTHEAIISKDEFSLVNRMMLYDTRIAPEVEALYPFSGLLECAGCGGGMIRKPVKSHGKKYIYYICAANKASKEQCGHSRRIDEKQLMDCVLKTLQSHIRAIGQFDKLSAYIETLPLNRSEIQKVYKLLAEKNKDLEKFRSLKHSLYEDYKENILDKNDYLEMKSDYEQICFEAEKALFRLEAELAELNKNRDAHSYWIESFKRHSNITELTRTALLNLVQKITITSRNRIHIFFNYTEFDGG